VNRNLFQALKILGNEFYKHGGSTALGLGDIKNRLNSQMASSIHKGYFIIYLLNKLYFLMNLSGR
jgi:hypothetical protein